MTAPSTPATTVAVPIIRGAGEGERRWFYGGGERRWFYGGGERRWFYGGGERRWFYGRGIHIWKASAAETGGAFLMFEDEMEQGKVTPLHIHPDADETLYMLEGRDPLARGRPGTPGRHRRGGDGAARRAARIPRPVGDGAAAGRAHPRRRRGSYRGASEPITGDGSGSGVVDFDRIRASAEINGGIEILGPPPFARH